ncbi:MAG: DUF1848 family protein [Bacillota bacterium]
MSLFDGKPIEIDNRKKKVVLTASRMTDMPKYYPEEIIKEVHKRLDRGIEIHTLVLLTKHPRSLLSDPLKGFLLNLQNNGIQISAQITITGVGGMVIGKKANGKPLILEPQAPSCKDSLKALPEVITLAGLPERIRIRFDPIVRLTDSEGNLFSNIKYLPLVVETASGFGIKDFSFSFLEKNTHKKVDQRFRMMGCTIIPPTTEEREKFKTWLKRLEEKNNVNIFACSVPGFEKTSCIDGQTLQKTHPDKEPADLSHARKRQLCGCTKSIDLGGWPPKKCFTGCDYCYAHPAYSD